VFSDSKTFIEVGNGPNWLVTSFHFKMEVCADIEFENTSIIKRPINIVNLNFIFTQVVFKRKLYS
jgi:hypothetical protein